MAGTIEETGFGRLEDFISFAKTGTKLGVHVDLTKQFVSQRVHPGNNEEMKGEMDMYFLSAVYNFKVGGDVRKVSKVYMLASAGESSDEAKINAQIANARLREDYKRLNDVGIAFDEKFF
ncbi:MAG TPA: hypothetical protein VMB78_07650 [Dissulfurispiraceae bacterium]|nr:hypothetical protein [Dissulfurispiraceae bacterium]